MEKDISAILIGSRAWNKDFDAGNGGKADWDLILTAERAADLLGLRTIHHYRPYLEQGKLSFLHQSGAKVELEIMEKFESTKILKELSSNRKETLKIQNELASLFPNGTGAPIIWSTESNIPSKEALLVIKASHIYFPGQWRKNFLQLVSMVRFFRKSLSAVIKEDPKASLLKELFQTRARETLHRIRSHVLFSTNHSLAPSIQELKDCAKGYYNCEKFAFEELLQMKHDPSDTFLLPSTGLKLSKAAWLKYNQDQSKCQGNECVGKTFIIYEQLVLLALHHYLPQQRSYGFLNKLKKEDQITELFLVCLETFVTQQLVSVYPQPVHHPQFKSSFPVKGDEITNDIYEVDLYETVPLASNAELMRTSFANPMVNWFIDNIHNEYDHLQTAFAAFFQPHTALFAHKPVVLPNLPFEVIDLMHNLMPEDYVLLAKLSSVCKAWKRYFGDNDKWRVAINQFDEQTLALANKLIKDKYPRHLGELRVLFGEIQLLSRALITKQYCEHCHNMHAKVDNYAPDEREECYDGRCVCPGCSAGSWELCPYVSNFVFS